MGMVWVKNFASATGTNPRAGQIMRQAPGVFNFFPHDPRAKEQGGAFCAIGRALSGAACRGARTGGKWAQKKRRA